MFDWLTEMLSYQFMTRALIVGVLISLCSALLGVSLVLKRYSMIGDGLSHVGFGSLAIATALGWAPMAVTIPAVMLSAFLLLRLNNRSKVGGESVIAMLSTGALAVGVIALTLGKGMTGSVSSYLFGSVLAMTGSDVSLTVVLSAGVLILFLLFYRPIFSITFDETFARATGNYAGKCNILLALMTALVIVLGMRVMGTMLISGLILFPPLSAMRLCRRYRQVTIVSGILSVVCYVVGLCVSYLADIPTGATVIVMNLLVYLLCTGIAKIRQR